MSRESRASHAVYGVTVGSCALAVAMVVLSMLSRPQIASAHVPFIESAQRSDEQGTENVPYPQAQTVPSPTISRAIYGYLAPTARFDAYTFTVAREVTTEVSLIVPKRAGLQTFRPSLRIYAEGSDKALTVSDPGSKPRTSFYEPFSIASFWDGPVTTATFKPGERYYAVIQPPRTGRASGAYVLTFGGAEEFSASGLGLGGCGDAINLARLMGGRPGAPRPQRMRRCPRGHGDRGNLALGSTETATDRPGARSAGGVAARRGVVEPNYQPIVPGEPLNGPTTSLVTQPP